MKQAVIFLCTFLFLNVLSAQTTLTKQETITYIQKKINEGLSHKYGEYTLKSEDVSISECKMTITRKTKTGGEDLGYRSDTYSSYKTYESIYTFDPRLISSVTESSPSSGSLKILNIKLKGKSATYKYWNEYYTSKQDKKWVYDYRYEGGGYYTYSTYYIKEDNRDDKAESTDTITLYFLGSDATNFNKLKKAFEHLRDLCEAEDDPFGE